MVLGEGKEHLVDFFYVGWLEQWTTHVKLLCIATCTRTIYHGQLDHMRKEICLPTKTERVILFALMTAQTWRGGDGWVIAVGRQIYD